MKTLPSLLLLCALTAPAFAEEAAPAKVTPPAAAAAAVAAAAPSTEPKAIATLSAAAAKLTAPMVLKDGAISQPDGGGLTDGGQAVFEFTVPKDGEYGFYAVLEAPAD